MNFGINLRQAHAVVDSAAVEVVADLAFLEERSYQVLQLRTDAAEVVLGQIFALVSVYELVEFGIYLFDGLVVPVKFVIWVNVEGQKVVAGYEFVVFEDGRVYANMAGC